MSEPFLAEVRMVGFNFPPRGWAFCDGQILPINQNQSLFSLLGTIYGGDGRTTFGLPDLRGRTPIHVGNGRSEGNSGGEEAHVLASNEMPTHTHTAMASNDPSVGDDPTNRVLGQAGGNAYAAHSTGVAMAGSMISNVGAGQSHNNMQPYLAVNFCIALQGIFPSRN